ncbi:conserved hypothetical protein [Ricinus communis]|uniref:Uncharacterized protein n=1 Tax=Ricinus communis TaxID=3988 RepID=B9S161_RICCO|nr:conserved hypothetical protein [Ricinus communis]
MEMGWAQRLHMGPMADRWQPTGSSGTVGLCTHYKTSPVTETPNLSKSAFWRCFYQNQETKSLIKSFLFLFLFLVSVPSFSLTLLSSVSLTIKRVFQMANNDDDDDTAEMNDLASEIHDRIFRISIGTQIMKQSSDVLIKNIENLKHQQEDSKRRLNQLKRFRERYNASQNLELDAKIVSLKKLLHDINTTDEIAQSRDLNPRLIRSGIEVKRSGVQKKIDDHQGFKKAAANDDVDKQEGSGVDSDDISTMTGGLKEDMIMLLGPAENSSQK